MPSILGWVLRVCNVYPDGVIRSHTSRLPSKIGSGAGGGGGTPTAMAVIVPENQSNAVTISSGVFPNSIVVPAFILSTSNSIRSVFTRGWNQKHIQHASHMHGMPDIYPTVFLGPTLSVLIAAHLVAVLVDTVRACAGGIGWCVCMGGVVKRKGKQINLTFHRYKHIVYRQFAGVSAVSAFKLGDASYCSMSLQRRNPNAKVISDRRP